MISVTKAQNTADASYSCEQENAFLLLISFLIIFAKTFSIISWQKSAKLKKISTQLPPKYLEFNVDFKPKSGLKSLPKWNNMDFRMFHFAMSQPR